jgi:hypothetical protein
LTTVGVVASSLSMLFSTRTNLIGVARGSMHDGF